MCSQSSEHGLSFNWDDALAEKGWARVREQSGKLLDRLSVVIYTTGHIKCTIAFSLSEPYQERCFMIY